jgi:hypothetical protein
MGKGAVNDEVKGQIYFLILTGIVCAPFTYLLFVVLAPIVIFGGLAILCTYALILPLWAWETIAEKFK